MISRCGFELNEDTTGQLQLRQEKSEESPLRESIRRLMEERQRRLKGFYEPSSWTETQLQPRSDTARHQATIYPEGQQQRQESSIAAASDQHVDAVDDRVATGAELLLKLRKQISGRAGPVLTPVVPELPSEAAVADQAAKRAAEAEETGEILRELKVCG